MGYWSSGRPPQPVVQTSHRELCSSTEIEVPHTLKALLLFQALSFDGCLPRQKRVKALHIVCGPTGITIRIITQRIVMAFSAICFLVGLRPLSKVIAPYVLFDEESLRLSVQWFCVNLFAPIMWSKSLAQVNGPLSDLDGEEPKAYDNTSGNTLPLGLSLTLFSVCCTMSCQTTRCMR